MLIWFILYKKKVIWTAKKKIKNSKFHFNTVYVWYYTHKLLGASYRDYSYGAIVVCAGFVRVRMALFSDSEQKVHLHPHTHTQYTYAFFRFIFQFLFFAFMHLVLVSHSVALSIFARANHAVLCLFKCCRMLNKPFRLAKEQLPLMLHRLFATLSAHGRHLHRGSGGHWICTELYSTMEWRWNDGGL